MNLSSITSRPRKSLYEAIPINNALNIVEEIFNNNINQLINIEKIDSKLIKTGDILAENVYSQLPHPSFRASIKDGYAVIAADGAGKRFVYDKITAEKSINNFILKAGNAYRINTGAALPVGADSIVQVEDTELIEHNNIEEIQINILKAPRIGQDIREIGSDVAKDELLIQAGYPLMAADIGLLALSNISAVKRFQTTKVVVLSTGNELIDEPKLSIENSNAIRDTNRPVLLALFKAQGFSVKDGGICKDIKSELIDTIKNLLKDYSILVVTGGVSMGEKDYLKQILIENLNFRIHFGRVLMKPGLPTTFASGTIDNSPMEKFIFGLPGNPVSGFVTAQLFVIPMLKKISGYKNYQPTRIRVKVNKEILLDSRPEYCRATFKECLPNGIILAEPISGSQISSRLLSVRSTNFLLELPPKLPTKDRITMDDLVTALVIERL